jgi:3-oxoacyl-[acyl-carrier protein] reductase
MSMHGKVALIVGGSQSIGRVISTVFAQEGAATAICSRPRSEPPPLVDELRQRGLEAMWAPGDMADAMAMDTTVDKVVARYGKLDILVVSGSPTTRPAALFELTDPIDFLPIVESQMVSRLNCLHAVLKPMTAAGYGKVVFLGTDAGRTPTPGSSVGGAATAGLFYFVRAAGKELARRGIRINGIGVPLTAETGSWDMYKSGEVLSDVHLKAYAKIEERTPFGMTVAKDLADAALFLAGPQSDQISGTVLSVNGGLSFP